MGAYVNRRVRAQLRFSADTSQLPQTVPMLVLLITAAQNSASAGVVDVVDHRSSPITVQFQLKMAS